MIAFVAVVSVVVGFWLGGAVYYFNFMKFTVTCPACGTQGTIHELDRCGMVR